MFVLVYRCRLVAGIVPVSPKRQRLAGETAYAGPYGSDPDNALQVFEEGRHNIRINAVRVFRNTAVPAERLSIAIQLEKAVTFSGEP